MIENYIYDCIIYIMDLNSIAIGLGGSSVSLIVLLALRLFYLHVTKSSCVMVTDSQTIQANVTVVAVTEKTDLESKNTGK